MNAPHQESGPASQTRQTVVVKVVVMPERRADAPPASPARRETPEPHDEPGYGHGV